MYEILNTSGNTVGDEENIANIDAFTVQYSMSGSTGTIDIITEISLDNVNWVEIDKAVGVADTDPDFAVNKALMPANYIRAKTENVSGTITVVANLKLKNISCRK